MSRLSLRRPASWIALVLATSFLLALQATHAGAADRGTPALLPSLPTTAVAEAIVEDDGPQLEARLLVSKSPSPRVGVLFDLAPGWHLYWRNPGETGIAPRLGLTAPGHRVGEIEWPVPETFREADGLFTTYGYEERVLLTAPIDGGPSDAASGGTLRAEADVLVCRTQCVPAAFVLETPIDPALSPGDQAIVEGFFRDAAASVPTRAAQLGLDATARWSDASPATDETRSLELIVHACAPEGAETTECRPNAIDPEDSVFLPFEGETFEFSGARVETLDEGEDAFTIAMDATRLEAGPDRLRGLVSIRMPDGKAGHVELDLPIRGPGSEAALPVAAVSPDPIGAKRWAQIFLLALIGGLILNGMPCVLPVLAIKIVSIAHMAEHNAQDVRLHGLAYTAGVLGSMGALAAVVIALRAAGHSVGWGFQFQEPIFVAAISALLVAFALNLFGVFEIELGQGRLASVGQNAAGFRRSVFEGLLAVVLATPCTAPFLGTAVGFAFATSGAGIAAIFLAIGFGLASPFLIVSLEPRLARFVPRSGPWMIKLRGGLGFSLLATVVWLLWVLGRSGGTNAVIAMIGNLLFLAFLLWGYGQLQSSHRPRLARAGAVAILGLAVAGLNLIDFDQNGAAGAHEPGGDAAESIWSPYSPEAVSEALASGRPAFVVFTADWCITCQVNEETVLKRESVRAAFREQGFALFKADWTRRDEKIRLKLAEFGRAGVPLYLVYSPERPERPQVLSELLSQREVLASLHSGSLAQRP